MSLKNILVHEARVFFLLFSISSTYLYVGLCAQYLCCSSGPDGQKLVVLKQVHLLFWWTGFSIHVEEKAEVVQKSLPVLGWWFQVHIIPKENEIFEFCLRCSQSRPESLLKVNPWYGLWRKSWHLADPPMWCSVQLFVSEIHRGCLNFFPLLI